MEDMLTTEYDGCGAGVGSGCTTSSGRLVIGGLSASRARRGVRGDCGHVLPFCCPCYRFRMMFSVNWEMYGAKLVEAR
jgi:hypothetical protein